MLIFAQVFAGQALPGPGDGLGYGAKRSICQLPCESNS